jgi:hypothetical protein
MRPGGLVSGLLVMAAALRAHADDAPAPASAPDEVAVLRAEVERQAAAIEQLRAGLAQEGRLRENPTARLSGYAQVDWTLYNQASQNQVDYSTNQPLNGDRFTLRRGHIRLDAGRGVVSASLEVDANTVNGPQLRPIDAELGIRWPDSTENRLPQLAATLGLMKIPFGFEVPELDVVRPFLERSTVMRALFPGEFDLGVRFAARYRFLEWTIALLNGNPIGDKVFPALAPSRTKEIVGRFGTQADVAGGVRFEAGVSADAGVGFHEGTPTTKAQLIWRDENGDGIVQPTEIQVIPGSAATPSQEFRRFAVGADARLTIPISSLGELELRAEIVRGQNLDRGVEYADPVGTGHDLRELGWYVGATQEITRWAMVGVRYDQYNPDQDASQQRAIGLVPTDRTYRSLALLAMLRYRSARLLVEYDKNGNALGLAANGSPTTLNDDALTVRGQVQF